MKMGGHVSEGLVLPITLIEGGGDLPVGTVVTQQLGIRRYEGGQSQKEPSRPLWWMRHPMLRALMKLFGGLRAAIRSMCRSPTRRTSRSAGIP